MNKLNEMLIKSISANPGTAIKLKSGQAGYMRIGISVITCMTMFLVFGCTVFAATGIETKIQTGMQSAYKVIEGVTIPVAIIAFAFCAFQIFAGGEKGMEKAKKCAIYTIIGLAIVFLAL